MFPPNKFRFVATNIRSFMFVKPFARLLRHFSICFRFSFRLYKYIVHIISCFARTEVEFFWQNHFSEYTQKKWMCLIRETFSTFAAFVFCYQNEKEYLYLLQQGKARGRKQIWNTMLSDKRKIVLLNLFPNCSFFLLSTPSPSHTLFSFPRRRRRRRHCYTMVAMVGVMQK